MDLLQQWCAKEGVTRPVNGSWLFAICNHYRVTIEGNALYNLAGYFRADQSGTIPLIQAIAIAKGARGPVNGSWLQAIVDL
jgi:predicted small secreted protein